MIYKLSEISEIIDAQYYGNQDCEIEYILTDSRNITTTDRTLFFAINGTHHDAHDYIPELYNKGIRNFVIEEYIPFIDKNTDANFLLIGSSIEALQTLNAHKRKLFKNKLIGITGSNGKTIVKEWFYHVLQIDKKVYRSPKSFNSQLGVPLSVWLLNNDYDLGVFEAGISKPGEMNRLQKILTPNIGLITNIGEPHQENFESYSHKASEKLQLFKDSELVIYCKDHSIIEDTIKKSEFNEKTVFTWSEKQKADLQIDSINKKETETEIVYQYKNDKGKITIPFTHSASIEDAIHVLALIMALGYKLDQYTEQFKTLPSVAMRMELKKGKNNCTIINDSYNSDLNSLSIALNYLNQQTQHKIKTLILSDIFQSGKSDDELYTEIANLLNQFNVDRLIGIGETLQAQKDRFNVKSEFYPTTESFLKVFDDKLFVDEAILLKGSRQFKFEKISKVLEEKAHRTVLEINLNALVNNLNYFKSKLNANTKIMVMVKALSYGSGTHEIANILQYHGVDYLGVAVADEGVALRKAGIKVPIIVMNPEVNSFDLMLEHNLEPEVYNFKVLRQFIASVQKNGIAKYPIHLKLDTGMHRLGFVTEEIEGLIDEIKQSDELKVSSIFSHLAASDEQVHDDFTYGQIERLKEISDRIISELGYKIDRHILNSAGIERFPEAQFEMVRLGIGLYGVSSTSDSLLDVVSTLKTTVLQVKQVKKNQSVGYSRKGKAIEDTTIAIIPIGYADGIDRKLGNGNGRFYINGCFVHTIGNICMDMCMLDITNCNIHEGDEVIIFGKECKVETLAKTLETIPYEIFTSISTRVKRVYFQE